MNAKGEWIWMHDKIKEKITQIKNNGKSGVNTLEMIAIALIFMVMFGFFFDTFIILNKQYVASKEMNVATRQIAMQGGLEPVIPEDYNRFGQDYASSPAFFSTITNNLAGVDIVEFEMGLRPDLIGQRGAFYQVTPSTSARIEYGDKFTLRLDYKYKWHVMGGIVPGLKGDKTRTIERSAVSELGGE